MTIPRNAVDVSSHGEIADPASLKTVKDFREFDKMRQICVKNNDGFSKHFDINYTLRHHLPRARATWERGSGDGKSLSYELIWTSKRFDAGADGQLARSGMVRTECHHRAMVVKLLLVFRDGTGYDVRPLVCRHVSLTSKLFSKINLTSTFTAMDASLDC